MFIQVNNFMSLKMVNLQPEPTNTFTDIYNSDISPIKWKSQN